MSGGSLVGFRHSIDAHRAFVVFAVVLISLAIFSLAWAALLIDENEPTIGAIVGQLATISAEINQVNIVAAAATATAAANDDYRLAVYILMGSVILITVISVVVVAYLNTSLVRTKRKLQNQSEGLRTTNIVKERFLTSASHELNTPITVATALTDVLSKNRDGNLTERQLSQLAVVQRNNMRLSGNIDSMIQTSASGIYHGLHSEKIVYSEYLSSILDAARDDLELQGVRIESSVVPSDARVEIDTARVEQAITNLLTNAVQHSPDGSAVTVSLEQAGDRIKTCVRDSGVGIAEQDREHVFSPFYRSDSEHSRRLRGLGLGLTMVKRIVEGHGGEVGFESNPGNKGVTFCFTLPVAE